MSSRLNHLINPSQTNFVRCTMGAALVSVIDFILSALRPGWTYTLLALICLLMLPTNWVVIKFGPKWRARRKQMAEPQA